MLDIFAGFLFLLVVYLTWMVLGYRALEKEEHAKSH